MSINDYADYNARKQGLPATHFSYCACGYCTYLRNKYTAPGKVPDKLDSTTIRIHRALIAKRINVEHVVT